MNEAKIEYGFTNVHIAVRTMKTGEDGIKKIEYAVPKPFPNGKSTEFSAKGESVPVQADNRIIINLDSNLGYEGPIVFTNIPDWFFEEILNHQRDVDKSLLEMDSSKSKEFALLFQIENDVKARRFCFYNCVVTNRPNIASKTLEQTPSVEDRTLNISARPDPDVLLGYNVVKKVSTFETSKVVYEKWFKEVPLPSITEVPAV